MICLTLVWQMTQEQQPVQKVRLLCQMGLARMSNASCSRLFVGSGVVTGGTEMLE